MVSIFQHIVLVFLYHVMFRIFNFFFLFFNSKKLIKIEKFVALLQLMIMIGTLQIKILKLRTTKTEKQGMVSHNH